MLNHCLEWDKFALRRYQVLLTHSSCSGLESVCLWTCISFLPRTVTSVSLKIFKSFINVYTRIFPSTVYMLFFVAELKLFYSSGFKPSLLSSHSCACDSVDCALHVWNLAIRCPNKHNLEMHTTSFYCSYNIIRSYNKPFMKIASSSESWPQAHAGQWTLIKSIKISIKSVLDHGCFLIKRD